MPKRARELSAIEVSRLKTPGLWPVGGVAGLCLQVMPSGARSWIFRKSVAGRRREMGLGGFPDVTLADARNAARVRNGKIAAGVDPLAELQEKRAALRAAVAKAWTFKQCAEGFLKAKSPEWKNAKHAAQWTSTLETYAYPHIGHLLVGDIELPHVLAVLEPIWITKTETASRVRGRIETILDWATTRKYRDGLNPARWRGHLDNQLPAPKKIAPVRHHPALAIDAVPPFMRELRSMEGLGARALEFAILTAARSGEARGARWSEIDLDTRTWEVPKERMKIPFAHRVPLSRPAIKLLRALPRIVDGEGDADLVFPSDKGTELSDATLGACVTRLNERHEKAPWIDPRNGAEATPHGIARSSFKDWASERTAFPNEVSEKALAHVVKDDTEAAYRRGDLFDKRVKLMQAWSEFCDQPLQSAKVTPIRKARASRG